jgi:hypothetical protein
LFSVYCKEVIPVEILVEAVRSTMREEDGCVIEVVSVAVDCVPPVCTIPTWRLVLRSERVYIKL